MNSGQELIDDLDLAACARHIPQAVDVLGHGVQHGLSDCIGLRVARRHHRDVACRCLGGAPGDRCIQIVNPTFAQAGFHSRGPRWIHCGAHHKDTVWAHGSHTARVPKEHLFGLGRVDHH